MSILRVTRMGHPVLRQKARPVPPEHIADAPVQRLVDDMLETMDDYDGIGLAAPQVFQPLRLIVLGQATAADEEPGPVPLTVLFNPVWVERSPQTEDGWEGCLSIPDIRGVVPRSAQVRVRGLDRDGRVQDIAAAGLYARVLQHEIDHLDGILFFDRMKNFETLTFMDEFHRYWAAAEDSEDSEEDAEDAEDAEDGEN